jgi:hypothetical protein
MPTRCEYNIDQKNSPYGEMDCFFLSSENSFFKRGINLLEKGVFICLIVANLDLLY